MRAPLLLLPTLFLLGCISAEPSQPRAEVTLPDGFAIHASIADSLEERAIGLSGRPALSEDEGMLLVHASPSKPGVWMPNMNFPIDMLFLDGNFTVVDANVDARPCTQAECPFFVPQADCLYILEIPANSSIRHGTVIGSRLSVRFG